MHTCGTQGDMVVDLDALRASADHNPHIERHLVLLFTGTAERCLGRMQRLVVQGDRREWQSIVHELKVASANIHAKELATLCGYAAEGGHDAVARMRVYLQIKEAYEGLLIHFRNAHLLTHTGQGS